MKINKSGNNMLMCSIMMRRSAFGVYYGSSRS